MDEEFRSHLSFKSVDQIPKLGMSLSINLGSSGEMSNLISFAMGFDRYALHLKATKAPQLLY